MNALPNPQSVAKLPGDRKLCGAKSKRTGEPCRGLAMANGRCRMHNGNAARGAAAGPFKTGRYSKDLPTRLRAQYDQSLSDPDLLVMREDIALLDSRLADLLKNVDGGESGSLWKQLRGTWNGFAEARSRTDVNEMTARLSQIEQLIQRGSHESLAWGEIVSLLDNRRKLVESERKRLIDLQLMITSERALLLIGAIEDIVRKNVEDRDVMANIARGIRGLITDRASGSAQPG